VVWADDLLIHRAVATRSGCSLHQLCACQELRATSAAKSDSTHSLTFICTAVTTEWFELEGPSGPTPCNEQRSPPAPSGAQSPSSLSLGASRGGAPPLLLDNTCPCLTALWKGGKDKGQNAAQHQAGSCRHALTQPPDLPFAFGVLRHQILKASTLAPNLESFNSSKKD